MAITDSNGNGGMYMPVGPIGYGGGNGGFADGGFGGIWGIILLLLCLGNGMWGGFGGGMWPMMMGGMGGFGMDYLYPWLNNSQNINGGFRDQQLSTQLGGIQNAVTSGFGDVQTALCGGFAGVNAAVVGAQNAITQQMYANQIADMQQNFAAQTANMQGFNNVAAQGADLKYTVATEACADRAALAEGIRDVMENCNRNNQAVLDKLCALELDGVKGQLAAAQRENVGLQNQLNMATMQASQAAQTAAFQQGMNAEVDALYNRLKNCPVNTVPVYGSQPIFTCGGNNGFCCNNNGFIAA